MGASLFHFFTDVQQRDLQEIREANFGAESLLPDDIFSNQMIHGGDAADTLFMIEEYRLMFGNRLEDPDKFDSLLFLIRHLLSDIDSEHQGLEDHADPQSMVAELSGDIPSSYHKEGYEQELDSMIMCSDNMDGYFGLQSSTQALGVASIVHQRRQIMKKWMLISSGTILVIIIVVLIIGLSNLGTVIKTTVNAYGPEMTQTEIRLKDVDVSLFSAKAALKDFFLGNPQGFKSPQAMTVGSIYVDVDEGSLADDTIIIDRIEVIRPILPMNVKGEQIISRLF